MTVSTHTNRGTKTLIHLFIHPKISILPGNNKLPGRNRVGVLVTLELLLRTIGKLAIAFIFLIFDYWFKLLNIQEI